MRSNATSYPDISQPADASKAVYGQRTSYKSTRAGDSFMWTGTSTCMTLSTRNTYDWTCAHAAIQRNRIRHVCKPPNPPPTYTLSHSRNQSHMLGQIPSSPSTEDVTASVSITMIVAANETWNTNALVPNCKPMRGETDRLTNELHLLALPPCHYYRDRKCDWTLGEILKTERMNRGQIFYWNIARKRARKKT